jgi:hypothetical protein
MTKMPRTGRRQRMVALPSCVGFRGLAKMKMEMRMKRRMEMKTKPKSDDGSASHD